MWLLHTLRLVRDLWKQIVALDRTETSIGPLPLTAAAVYYCLNLLSEFHSNSPSTPE